MRASRAGLRSRHRMLETLLSRLPMVRLTVTSSLLAMVGCTGLIDAPPPSKAEEARQLWLESALPALKSAEANCQTCHGGATPRDKVGFMIGDDDFKIRETLLAFDPPVLSLDAPQSSRLLNKGQHEGPPLVGQQKSDVQAWIQAEKEAATSVGPGGGPGGLLGLRSQNYTIALCTGGLPGDATCPINTIPLDDLGSGAGITGAKISFVAIGVGTGLYMNNLKLVPGPQGAYIEHPLFVSIPTDEKAEPIADTFDRFFNTKMNLMATAAADLQQISGGTAAFVNFPPQNQIAVYFKTASAFKPDTGGGGGGATGCKVPASFETNARNPLNTNCGNCHRGTNANATSALDLTGANAANATTACNQTRLRINFTNIDASGIFLATQPGNANHPFTFGGNAAAHTAFKNALNPWIIAERDAP
jgi:mono/diheme cytochrome c family protein